MESQLHICILMLSDVAIAFKRESQQVWQDFVIKGEASFLHTQKANTVEEILDEITLRLHRKNKLADVQVSLVYAHDCRQLMENSLKVLHRLGCEQWQILRWESLYQHASAMQTNTLEQGTPSTKWIKDYILPLLSYDAELALLKQQEHERVLAKLEAEKQSLNKNLHEQESTAKQNHEKMLASLQIEKQKLLQELQQLKHQTQVLARPDMEGLLSFLPAIFKDFWNKVRPDELALLAGNLSTPVIPSPYHSPSSQAVMAKKRQFLQLAIVDQQQIKRFCLEIKRNYPLDMHPEFAPIITEGD